MELGVWIGSTSSLSVLATKDEKTARTVYNLVAKCGIAHLYKVNEPMPKGMRADAITQARNKYSQLRL